MGKNTLMVKAADSRKGGTIVVEDRDGPPAEKDGAHLARFLYFNLPAESFFDMRKEFLKLEVSQLGIDGMIEIESFLLERAHREILSQT